MAYYPERMNAIGTNSVPGVTGPQTIVSTSLLYV